MSLSRFACAAFAAVALAAAPASAVPGEAPEVEQRVEALLGQDVVEDVREPAVRLDQRVLARAPCEPGGAFGGACVRHEAHLAARACGVGTR